MTPYDIAGLAFLLVAGHALADRGLQPEQLSRGKVESLNPGSWLEHLLAHGLIHGLVVALVTGLWPLGVAETVAHCLIDHARGRGRLSMMADQTLHMLCKVVWIAVTVAVS